MSPRMAFSDSLAGPMVQTILVRRISLIYTSRSGNQSVPFGIANLKLQIEKSEICNLRFRAERGSSHARPCPLQARIEDVPEGVAEQLDAQHREENAETGKKRQPPCGTDVDASVRSEERR